MDAIASNLISLVSSPVLEELGLIWNFNDDLEKLNSTVSAIKAVLADAEGKATNHQVSDWLQKVRDCFFDADDLLDELSAEALRRQVMTGNKTAKEVRIFFSKSNQLACYHKMGRKLKGITERLDQITKVKNDLKLIESAPQAPILYRERETYSFVPEHEVIGREEEKNRIISYLLDSNVKDNVSVVSVIGFGGLGKTALAQLVYNDKAVQKYFDLNMWVCVFDETGFDIKQIAQKILGDETCSRMEKVQQDLRKNIEGKRFLLVLDDVWNEDPQLWLKFKNLLEVGERGSKIIVTTRSKIVARIMDAHSIIDLEGLHETKSWELFFSVAFAKDEEPNAKLVEIGKDIVRKCRGVPLVIKIVGRLLYSRNLGERDWIYFRDCEVWKENKILPILKLSYDHLPSYLKICFAYCSLFPKDSKMKRKTLIQLWVAQGFIQSSDQSRCVEDVAHEYFMMLLSRCLLQDVEHDEDGDIRTCKMHDLIHDLAQLVTKNDYTVLSERREGGDIGHKLRHLSVELNERHKFPKRLRVLHFLPGSFIEKLPKSIGELKHLRYIDLSGGFKIERLPQSITKLHNLQTLKLNFCYFLKELPRDINKLVSLRHLELDGCNSLVCMPHRLGRLTCLRTLTKFVLNDKQGSGYARISELRGLNSLTGKLAIEGLDYQRSNMEEVESAKILLDKPGLGELELLWSNHKVEGSEYSEEVGHKDEMTLEALQPHQTIKRVQIKGFRGKRLPEWIWNLTSLQMLELHDCSALKSLPESIGKLTLLHNLELYDCSALKSLPESMRNLTLLRNLELRGCSALESLPESIGNLTLLHDLDLHGCSVLESLPESIGKLTLLHNLELYDCFALKSLPESIRNLTLLRNLELHGCSALESLPESIGNLTLLRDLDLHGCSVLESLPESIKNRILLHNLQVHGYHASDSCKGPPSPSSLSSLPPPPPPLPGFTPLPLFPRSLALEDQFFQVGSVHECGDDDDEEEGEFRRVEDVGNLGSSMTPLLS